MYPNDEKLSDNRDAALENDSKYEKEFIRASYWKKNNDIFKLNKSVLIRNEIRKLNMYREFNEKGKVLNSIGNICCQVKIDDGRILARHVS